MKQKKAKTKPTKTKPILVIGDLIVDVHHFGQGVGISHESGSVVGVQSREELTWGGAGLVVRNILALGGRASFLSVLGDDEYSAKAARFSHKNLKKLFLKEKGRQVIVKERFVVDGKKLFRWNRGEESPLPEKLAREIRRRLPALIARHKAVVIADYRGGLLNKELVATILGSARKLGVPIYVDSQVVRAVPNFEWYRGAHLLCLNEAEAHSALTDFSVDELSASLSRLKRELTVDVVVVKLGALGSSAMIGEEFIKTEGVSVEAVDPVGAGDAFLAALALGAFPPASDDLLFANRWAALATTTIGTEPPSRTSLKKIQ